MMLDYDRSALADCITSSNDRTLLAKSVLAVCSRDDGPGRPVLTQLADPLRGRLGG